jgi:hypothetical protein
LSLRIDPLTTSISELYGLDDIGTAPFVTSWNGTCGGLLASLIESSPEICANSVGEV